MEKLKNKIKNMKGITLVALIITVIILLIIAGVSISFIFGNEGVFNKAQTAVEQYKNAQEQENIVIAKYENEIDNYINNSREGQLNDYKENLVFEIRDINIQNGKIIDDSGNSINSEIKGTGITSNIENGRKYLSFDGTSYIQTEEFSELAGNTAKSICWNFRIPSPTNNSSFPYILAFGNGNVGKNGFLVMENNGSIRFDTGACTYWYEAGIVQIADNKWHFACITFDQQTLVLYIDNKPIFATAANLTTATPALTLGAYYSGANKIIEDLSDIRIYNKGLNIGEIYRIYTNIKR